MATPSVAQPSRNTHGLTLPLGQMGSLQPQSPAVPFSPQVAHAHQSFLIEIAKQIGLTTQQSAYGTKEYSFSFASYAQFMQKIQLLEQYILSAQPLPLGQTSTSDEEKQAYVNKLLEQAKSPYAMKFTNQHDYQLKRDVCSSFLHLKRVITVQTSKLLTLTALLDKVTLVAVF